MPTVASPPPESADSQPAAQDHPAAPDDEPAAQDPAAAHDELPVHDEPPAKDDEPEPPAMADEPETPADHQPPAEDQHEAEGQREAEGQPQDSPPAEETQQLPVTASAAADPAPADPAPATPDAVPDAAPASSEVPEPAADSVDLQREVTVVPGVPRYHNPQCLLIRFMGEDDLGKMTLGAARQAGCTPCRACLPDQLEADPELGPPEPERQAEIVLDVLPHRLGLRTRRLSRSRTRPGLDREHLAGDQPRVLGQGRDHIRVL